MKSSKSGFSKTILTAPMSREDAERICAVEALLLSPHMKALFDQAERDGVDGDELDRRINAEFAIV